MEKLPVFRANLLVPIMILILAFSQQSKADLPEFNDFNTEDSIGVDDKSNTDIYEEFALDLNSATIQESEEISYLDTIGDAKILRKIIQTSGLDSSRIYAIYNNAVTMENKTVISRWLLFIMMIKETGWYASSLFKNQNNLLGMTASEDWIKKGLPFVEKIHDHGGEKRLTKFCDFSNFRDPDKACIDYFVWKLTNQTFYQDHLECRKFGSTEERVQCILDKISPVWDEDGRVLSPGWSPNLKYAEEAMDLWSRLNVR